LRVSSISTISSAFACFQLKLSMENIGVSGHLYQIENMINFTVICVHYGLVVVMDGYLTPYNTKAEMTQIDNVVSENSCSIRFIIPDERKHSGELINVLVDERTVDETGYTAHIKAKPIF
jgi:hypothetical protein